MKNLIFSAQEETIAKTTKKSKNYDSSHFYL